jgi:carboxylesterase
VIAGAEPLVLDGGPRAALLLHGFGDTPQALAALARALHARGWTVRVPLLPGHGRSLEAFCASTARQWTAHARDAFDALRSTHEEVAIVGLSMGGALAVTLAARSGAEAPSPVGATTAAPPVGSAAALVLLAPFLELSPSARLWTTIWPLWSLWRRWVPGDAEASIRDPRARAESLGYGVATPRLLRQVRDVADAAAASLGALQLPTLVVHSVADYRISTAAAERGFARLVAATRELRWVQRSGHVITVDHDSAEVTSMVLDWLERHVPPSSVAATGTSAG